MVGELIEFLYSVSETYGKFLWREVRGAERGDGVWMDGPRRNWLPLSKVPWLGFWPKRTICCKETWEG